MSLFTRAFRSIRAATTVVAWPAHQTMEPSSRAIIAQTSATHQEDCTTNALPHQTIEENDTDGFSEWWTERFNDPKHTNQDQLG